MTDVVVDVTGLFVADGMDKQMVVTVGHPG